MRPQAQCHVVIVSFHSSDLVRACVARLDPVRCRSIVIVDNSVDSSDLAHLHEIRSDIPLDVLSAGGNIGFGAGVNRGVAALPDDGLAIWVLNPDTEPTREAAGALLDVLERGDSDAVSPLLVSGQRGEVIWYDGGTVDRRTGRVRHHRHRHPTASAGRGVRPVTFLCGAAPLFSRAAWRALGGFDERLFLYWEDVELSLRAGDLGLRMHVVSDAVVWHAVGGTAPSAGLEKASGDQSATFYRLSARNRIAVMRRRVGLATLLVGRGLPTTLRLAVHPLVTERRGRLGKAWAFARGVVEGTRF